MFCLGRSIFVRPKSLTGGPGPATQVRYLFPIYVKPWHQPLPLRPRLSALSVSGGVHDTLSGGGVDWRSREEGWAAGTYSGAIHHMLSPPPHKLVKNYQSLLEIILINFLGPAQTWSI